MTTLAAIAASEGNLVVLAWLLEKCPPGTAVTLTGAHVQLGFLKELELESIYLEASNGGHLHVLHWLKARGLLVAPANKPG